LDDLLAEGPNAGEFQNLREHLLARDDQYNVVRWISRTTPRQVLSQMSRGEVPIAHSALDTLPQTRGVQYLRRLLMQLEILPAIDMRRKSLELWATVFLREIEPSTGRLLNAYFRWSVMRRLGSKLRADHITAAQDKWARGELADARDFASWLSQRGMSIIELSQVDLDEFLASRRSRNDARHFIGWLAARHGARLTIPPRHRAEPSVSMRDEECLRIIRAILMDFESDPDRRLIALLVAVCGQLVSRVVRLPEDALRLDDTQILIRFGTHELQLPPTFRPTVEAHLLARRQASKWLFPGKNAGDHRSAQYTSRYLRSLGTTASALQTSARYRLAAALPAKVMADSFGFQIETANQYARLSGGSWRDAPTAFQDRTPSDTKA
jgi:hypothetical protein